MSDPRFRALQPGPEGGAEELIDRIVADASDPAARDAAGRPRTIGVMVQSIDGHVTVDGRSGGLGGPEDRTIFRGLRARADALLVGTGTLNGERYGSVLDPAHRAARLAQGRTPEPDVATISRSFSLERDVPLLDEDVTRTIVYSERAAPYDVDPGKVEVVVLDDLRPDVVLADLAARGAGLVNCEGGPGLLAALVAAGVLDELVVTVSPLLVGGDEATTMLQGALGSDGPVPVALRGVWSGGDVLFLHYHLTHGSSA